MLVTRFEELDIWKQAREIVNDIYMDFKEMNDFTFETTPKSTLLSKTENQNLPLTLKGV